MNPPIRTRDAHKLATTTYVNEIAEAWNSRPEPAMSNLPPALEANEVFVAIPIEALEGRGKYLCNICRRDVLHASLGSTFSAEDATVGSYPVIVKNAILTNLAEVEQGAHQLTLFKPVLSVFSGYVGSGGMAFTCHVFPPTDFTVSLVKDGGAQGTATTAATWTYTVETLQGEVLGTTVSLYRARPVGTTTFAPDNTYGKAQYINGTLVLLDAFKEVHGTVECP